MSGLFDDQYSNGIRVTKSAFGGFQVTYGNVRLQCQGSPTPAAAALQAIQVISANRNERPLDLIRKVEDPAIRSALMDHAKSLVENAKAGIVNKNSAAPIFQQAAPQQQQQAKGEFQTAPQQQQQQQQSLDKWSALEMLLNKNEDTYNKTRYGIQINQARQADGGIAMVTELIAKIEIMTEAEFSNSRLRQQLEAGDIQGAVRDHIQAVQNARRNRGLGNLLVQ